MDQFLNEPSLQLTLRIVMKLLKKGEPSTLDFLAVQILPKLKVFFDTRNNEILSRLLYIVSTIARAKADFYPRIASLDFGSKFSRYLSDPDINIRVKALNLIGNMVKHNNYFFEDFKKNGVPAAIVGTLSSAGGNH